MGAHDQASTPPPPPDRLVSIDALRGFDMFWIIGGDTLLRALAHGADWPFKGWIDEVSVWKRALSDTEVAALYQPTPSKVSTASGLVAHWSFDEAGGSTALTAPAMRRRRAKGSAGCGPLVRRGRSPADQEKRWPQARHRVSGA